MKKTIKRAERLAAVLLTELEDQTNNLNVLGMIGDLLGGIEPASDREAHVQEVWHKVTSLPARAKAMKDLAAAMKALATLKPRAKTGKRKP